MSSKILPALGVALALSLAAPAARATTSCSFDTIVSVAFGSYNVFSASPVDTLGSVSFSCLGVGGSDTIVIDLSRGNGASFAARYMSHSSDSLFYNLYLDAARTSLWGDGTAGTAHYGPVTPPNGSIVTVSIYGRISALQNVPAGSYGDTIVATIIY